MALTLDATTWAPAYSGGAQRRRSGLCRAGGLDRTRGHGQTCLGREWLRMLRQVRRAVPRSWTVTSWRIEVSMPAGCFGVSPGWGSRVWPVNTGGPFRPGPGACSPLKTFVPSQARPGSTQASPSKAATVNSHCTLLACWEAGDKDPWSILTDLPRGGQSGLSLWVRAWIGQGFNITKRTGWQWQRTHMTKPGRATRLWLAVAVATLSLLSVGVEAEETVPASTVLDVAALFPQQPRTRRATRLRLVSVFRRGWT